MQQQEEITLNKLIEEICRKICKNQSIDPNTLICKHTPEFINPGYMAGFFIPSKDHQIPAWMLYRDIVETSYEVFSEKFNLVYKK